MPFDAALKRCSTLYQQSERGHPARAFLLLAQRFKSNKGKRKELIAVQMKP
jgi:hypothetical protein